MHTPREISEVARQLYRHQQGFSVHIQTLRPYICPFEDLLPIVPKNSRVLDVGCGSGLFLGLLGASGAVRSAVGFDSNPAAIGLAQGMAKSLADQAQLDFRQIDAAATWPAGEFDVVSMIDVLHHVNPTTQLNVLSQAASKVRLGGIFLYKDMAMRPRWRAWANHLHDLVLAKQWIHLVPFSRASQHLNSIGMSKVLTGSATRYWYAHEWGVFSRET